MTLPRAPRSAFCLLLAALFPASSPAQVSLGTAVALALQHSPRVKLAEDDAHRSAAALTETKDAFLPAIAAGGGLGASYGITLTVPTIFTINAQSLLFNYSQRDYIRSSRAGLESSLHALEDAREQVEEDVAVTYLNLAISQEKAAALDQEYGMATQLVSIIQQRLDRGIESSQELLLARRDAAQVKLRHLHLQNDIASLHEHLTQLTSLPAAELVPLADSIPPPPPIASAAATYPDPPALLAAESNANAKQKRAFGDSRYTWRPQVAFEAQYGRVSPINGVTDYYNIHGNYNTATAGIQIQVPFFDAAHKARAEESLADSLHAAHQVDLLRAEQTEDQLKLQHSLAELATRAEIAELDHAIAQDQLKQTLLETTSGGFDGRPRTPRDEQNARIQERERYLDLLDARLQLRNAQIFQLRKAGKLEEWLSAPPVATP